MYIPRFYDEQLKQLPSSKKKAILIFGPRQCGKTTALETFLEQQKNYLYITGEDSEVQSFFTASLERLKNLIGEHTLFVIDEAQKIPSIGQNIKLIVDKLPQVQVIATGSSSFELAKQTGEPLTGRKVTLQCYPLSQIELNMIENPAQTKANLETRLIYGSYPEVILSSSHENRQDYLTELCSDYLFKDLLALDGIRKAEVLRKLLQLLAFQVGQEVSLNELADKLGIARTTVERYLDLLEKVFIIIRIGGFSKNLRKEIAKSSRYYFYDNGIRNALIRNFNQIAFRNDIGALWENYLVIERIKKQTYHKIYANNYFWRTYDQQEIDFVEEREGTQFAYEFKWSNKRAKVPTAWKNAYPQAHFNLINQENYLDFIT